MPRESKIGVQTLQLVSKEAPLEIVSRLKPPEELTDEQREEFCRVVGSMPADWFALSHVGMLVQYCRHVVVARRVGQAIEMMMSDPNCTTKGLNDLLKIQREESTVITRLMTKLRITPQSVDPPKSSMKRIRQVSSENPWNG